MTVARLTHGGEGAPGGDRPVAIGIVAGAAANGDGIAAETQTGVVMSERTSRETATSPAPSIVVTEPGTVGPRALVWIDVLRGVAAFLVVLGHSRALTLAMHGKEPTGEGWQRVALLPTSLAQEAVAIFFVLSGFLVGGQVLRQVSQNRFSWRAYVTRRLARLWSVLIPALVVTGLVTWLLIVIDAQLPEDLGRQPEHNSASTFVCNALFLQETRCKYFGVNTALWSLSYEFWFYIVFAGLAVAVFALGRRQLLAAAVGLAVAVGGTLIFGISLFTLFPAWLFGAALAVFVARRPPSARAQQYLPVFVLLLIFACIVSNAVDIPQWVRFAGIGLVSLPLVYSAASPDTPGSGARPVRSVAWVGSWSYTLYAFHLPFVCLAVWFLRDARGNAIWEVALIYAVAFAVAACCYPMFFLGESHTTRLRDLLLRLWPARAARRSESPEGSTPAGSDLPSPREPARDTSGASQS